MEESSRENTTDAASIDLYIRVKPLSSTERDDKKHNESILVSRSHKEMYVQMSEKMYRKFLFDHIFSETIRNVEIFSKSCQIQVDRFLKGFNSTVFVYGQSGTGKTYTMGLLDIIDNHSDGLVPLSINYIYKRLESMHNYSISISMVQVYNDEIYDLVGAEKLHNLSIREDSETKTFFIKGLHISIVKTEQAAIDQINAGLQHRTTAPQSLNQTSSRSHLVLTIYLSNKDGVPISKLTFVDLAGNERLEKSESKGIRRTEAIAINSSLSALSEAISHLKTSSDCHLSQFRNCKLTKILQSSLMGHSYICIYGMVRKSPKYVTETNATLTFVLNCKKIKLSEISQCLYKDVCQEVLEEQVHKEAVEERLSLAHGHYSHEEFTEFVVFLGKGLISLSGLVKKLTTEFSLRCSLQDISESETNEDFMTIPMEMVIDLSESESISDAVEIIKSAFKVIVEQLKKASDISANAGNELQEYNNKLKHEQNTRFSQQIQVFIKEFTKVISKFINQMMINKFESLSGMKDGKQAVPIMQHYADFTLSELLKESEYTLSILIGDQSSKSVINQIQSQIKQLFLNLTGSKNLSLTRINLAKNLRDCEIQTELEVEPKKPSISMLTKSTQYSATNKSIGIQTKIETTPKDPAAEKKLEYLMQAYKKLKGECDSFAHEKKSEIAQLNSIAEERAKEFARLKNRCMESETINQEVNGQMERLIKEFQKNKESLQRTQSDAEEYKVKSEYAELENRNLKEQIMRLKNNERRAEETYENEVRLTKEIDHLKNNYQGIQERLKSVMVEAGKEVASFKNSLIIEQQANEQLKFQLSQEIHNSVEVQKIITQKDKAISILEEEKKILISETKEFHFELEKQKEQLKEKEVENANALEIISRINEEKEDMIQQHNQQVSKLQDQINSLKSRIETENSQNRSLELDLKKKSDEELVNLRDRFHEASYRIRDLEKENNVLKEAEKNTITNGNQQLNKLNQKLNESAGEIKKLQEQLDQSRKENTDKEQTLKTATQKLISENNENRLAFERELSELKDKNSEASKIWKSEVESFEKRIKSLQDQSLGESQLKHQVDSLQMEISQKEKELIQSKESHRVLENSIRDLRDNIHTCQENINSLANENKTLVERLKLQTTDIKDKDKSNSELEEKLKIMQVDNKEKEDKIDNLKKTIETQETDFQNKMDELENQLKLLKIDLENLEEQKLSLNDLLVSKDNSIRSMEYEATQMKEKLESKELQIKSLQENMNQVRIESSEMKTMEKDLVNTSIQLAQKKEELNNKEKQISKLQTDIDTLKTAILEKAKDVEQVSSNYKRIVEELKDRLESAERKYSVAIEEQQKIHQETIQELKTQSSAQKTIVKDSYEEQIKRKEERINQLIRDTESKESDILFQRSNQISKLEEMIGIMQREMSEQTSSHLSELESSKSNYEKEISDLKLRFKRESEIHSEEKTRINMEHTKLLEEVKSNDERISTLSTDLEKQRNAMRYLEDCNSKLISLNNSLASKLKDIQKRQNSIPRQNSSQKIDNGNLVPPINPNIHHKQLGSGNNNEVHNVSSNLISNFDKQVAGSAANTKLGSLHNNNKENIDTNVTRQPNMYGQRKKEEEKSYDIKTLKESSNGNQSSVQIRSLHHSNLQTNSLIIESPHRDKLQGNLGLSGLHHIGIESKDEDFSKGDDHKVYSSRYSRASRNSRNSRRSPTPNKYPIEYSSHPGPGSGGEKL